MRPRIVAALLALFSLSGCYNDADSFIVAKAKHDCIRFAECNAALFEDIYGGNMDECRVKQEDLLDGIRDIAEGLGGEYDPAEGKECMAATRSLKRDCSNGADDEIGDACDRVYH